MADPEDTATKEEKTAKASLKKEKSKENEKVTETITSPTTSSDLPDTPKKDAPSPKKDASTDPLEDPDLIKTEELKDLLECPVCLRVPRSSPIYQVRQ